MNMNKNIIIAFVWLVMLPFTSFAQTFDYEIRGKIKGLNNDTLILGVMDNADKKPNMVKVPVHNDEFYTKGQANKPAIVFVRQKGWNGNFTFFLDKGLIKINGDSSNPDGIEVTGTPINDEFHSASKVIANFYKERTAVYKELSLMTDKKSDVYNAGMTKVDGINNAMKAFQLKYISEHPASLFSAMQVYLLADQISVLELEKLYNSLKSPGKDFDLLKKIPSRILAKKASQVGNVAPSFSSVDMNGKVIRLEDYKGKYVLLDFWASWCAPCRKENPGLIKAYKMFKGKRFEIISVAESDNDTKWRKAIADDKLGDWIHLFDLKDGKNVIGLQYGVQPIPDNFLISPDGKIIGRNLFGKALENKLVEVLGK
jgi:thiol-disulfide isomerase/thioredoxin